MFEFFLCAKGLITANYIRIAQLRRRDSAEEYGVWHMDSFVFSQRETLHILQPPPTIKKKTPFSIP